MRGFALCKTLMATLALGAAVLLAVPGARADEIEVTDARLAATEDGVVLAADFAFELNARLAEVVTNGVPLYFVVEFELTRPRWYWTDERAVTARNGFSAATSIGTARHVGSSPGVRSASNTVAAGIPWDASHDSSAPSRPRVLRGTVARSQSGVDGSDAVSPSAAAITRSDSYARRVKLAPASR